MASFLDNTGLQYLWGKLKARFLNTSDEGLPSFPEEFATYDGTNSWSCGTIMHSMSGSLRLMLPLSATPDFGGTGPVYVSSGTSDRTVTYEYFAYGGALLGEDPGEGDEVTHITDMPVDGVLTDFETDLYVKQDPFYGMWWITDSSSAITSSDLYIRDMDAATSQVGSCQLWFTDSDNGPGFDSDMPQDHAGFWEQGGVIHVRKSNQIAWDSNNTGVQSVLKPPGVRSVTVEIPSWADFFFSWDGSETSYDIGV